MGREREAVDSEFEMALPSDYNRMGQIFGSLAKDKHPMGKFMWGNTASLTGNKVVHDTAKVNTFLFQVFLYLSPCPMKWSTRSCTSSRTGTTLQVP